MAAAGATQLFVAPGVEVAASAAGSTLKSVGSYFARMLLASWPRPNGALTDSTALPAATCSA